MTRASRSGDEDETRAVIERGEVLRARVQARVMPLLPLLSFPAGPGRVIYYVVLGALALTGIGLSLVIPELIIGRWRRKRRRRRLIADMTEFVKNAELTYAYPIMINTSLREPGKQPAAGLFLIAGTYEAGEDAEFNDDVLEQLTLAGFADGTSPLVTFAKGLDDEEFEPLRLRPLPEDAATGVPMFAADLMIDPRLLPGWKFAPEMTRLPCLLDPKSRMTAILPQWLLDEPPMATLDHRDIFLDSLRQQWLLKESAGE